MDRLLGDKCSPKEMSTGALAFIGDAVYSLMVRERLCCAHRFPADTLHKRAVEMVRCTAQAEAIAAMLEGLTDEERAVYMRGRNAHSSHIPKGAAVADYRAATGLEALFGYIYLSDRPERLRELFDKIEALSHKDET